MTVLLRPDSPFVESCHGALGCGSISLAAIGDQVLKSIISRDESNSKIFKETKRRFTSIRCCRPVIEVETYILLEFTKEIAWL